jgi:hypothetical protein
MVGIVGDRKTSIVANLAEWCIGGTDPPIRKFAFRNRNRNRSRSRSGNMNTGGSLGIRVRTTK